MIHHSAPDQIAAVIRDMARATQAPEPERR